MTGFLPNDRRDASICPQISIEDFSLPHYLYLYLPDLPIQQASAKYSWPAEAISALYIRRQNTDRLVYLSAAALQKGLCAGISITDARARQPDIRLAEADFVHDHTMLEKLARWAWRYSPRTGIDPDGQGIWLDMTGTSHLHGGITAVIADIKQRLSALEMPFYCAVAPYYAAARAFARHHQDTGQTEFIAMTRQEVMRCLFDLPITALSIEAALCQAVSQAGLRRLHHLQPLSYAQLTIRFGPDFVKKWAEICGNRDYVPVAITPLEPLQITRSWHEPLAGYDGFAQMITDMATDIAKLLYEKELAARSFELGWQCSDAQIGRLYFHLSRPSRNADILNRLFAGAAERIDAEYGIDYSWLQAYQLASDLPVTAFLDIDSTDQEAQKIDHVLDILAAKLGPEKIRRAVHHPVWQISDSTTYRPLADTRQTAGWPVAAPGSLTPPRPIRLFDPAEPAYVTALLPDNPPALLRWRHKSWKIIKATGPERIGPRWWDNSCKSTKTRDYYRIETSTGLRLWIYREGLPERSEPAQWFVHGSFA